MDPHAYAPRRPRVPPCAPNASSIDTEVRETAERQRRGEEQETHERNWRVVMMVANSSAPNSLMVYRMMSWPVVAAMDSRLMSMKEVGCRVTNEMAGNSAPDVTSPKRDTCH